MSEILRKVVLNGLEFDIDQMTYEVDKYSVPPSPFVIETEVELNENDEKFMSQFCRLPASFEYHGQTYSGTAYHPKIDDDSRKMSIVLRLDLDSSKRLAEVMRTASRKAR